MLQDFSAECALSVNAFENGLDKLCTGRALTPLFGNGAAVPGPMEMG